MSCVDPSYGASVLLCLQCLRISFGSVWRREEHRNDHGEPAKATSEATHAFSPRKLRWCGAIIWRIVASLGVGFWRQSKYLMYHLQQKFLKRGR